MSESVQFVEANGLRFGYLEWGQGPLVLLFHGFPDTAHTWDVIGPRLAATGYRVVAPFMRGYAPTTLPTRDSRSLDLGQDVVALIPALGAAHAHIIGHDWGAEAVAAAVGLEPERIQSLTMVAVPHRASIKPSLALGWAARHFLTLRLPGALGRFSADHFSELDRLCRRWSPTWNFTAEDLKHVKAAFSVPGCANAALGYYRAATLSPPDFMRTRIGVPTLVIAGADDPTVPLEMYEAARRRFTGRYDVAAIGGGHFCHRESPDAFIAAVTPFLASIAA